jgi:molybdopterin-containing oxidoreductase family iron-sulfur binding subunit
MIRLPMIDDRPAPLAFRDHWRTLEEFADTPAFRELVEREFPEQAAHWHDEVSRRQFLTLMGASLALGGVAGCNTREPAVKIVPYVRQPDQVTPGTPLYFATAMPFAGGAFGVLVESHQGRPTKIEGNPEHPASLGATSAIVQASILGLYDPDRSKATTYLGQIRGWADAVAGFQRVVTDKIKPKNGRGLRILTETINSPTLAAQIDELLARFPEAKWHQYEPAYMGNAHAATTMAFGEPLDVRYNLKDAMRVVTLDADLFGSGPGHLRYAHDFMQRRRMRTPDQMNRLYAVESYPTGTGLIAEHRLAMPPLTIETFSLIFAKRIGVYPDDRTHASYDGWLNALVEDLRAHSGRSVVVAGDTLSADAHARVTAINGVLGNIGKTVEYIHPIVHRPTNPTESLRQLVDDMSRGEVEVLLILGGNPAFNAPVDFEFAKKLEQVPLRVHHSLYQDETSRLCQWHIPAAHYLESWSDCRAFDGTASFIQPLIAPLYAGKTAHEVIAAFGELPSIPSHEIVKGHWRKQRQEQGDAFEQWWRKSIHDGYIADSSFRARSVTLKDEWKRGLPSPNFGKPDTLEISFRPDPTIHDGRFTNNGWLQELPKPVTKLTWDNAAIFSPATAAKLGIVNRLGMQGGSHGDTIADTVDIVVGERTLAGVPALILPGHADNCVTLHYGYGSKIAGRVGAKTGHDVYAIRTSQAMNSASARITKTGHTASLAVTQAHHAIKSEEAAKRGLVRTTNVDELGKPGFHLHHSDHDGPLPHVAGVPRKVPMVGNVPNEMFPPHPYDGYKWGMSVDLSSCVGCAACVAACQAENNIPVVGKDQVIRGREMHWLRIDQYHEGDPNDSSSIHTVFQPVACMHCENAPCEVVCPVEATVHSPDGLNEMVYNRCVGTRYCSNNCPYKVRRFNFLLYADYVTESLKQQRNPEVTTRSRGVMEKCTFCVQRIRNAEINAKNQNRSIRDGEIVTACQAACPTQAISFGDMNDKSSKIYALKQEPLQYGLLSELNTRPRLTYSAVVRNPNPKLGGGHAHG